MSDIEETLLMSEQQKSFSQPFTWFSGPFKNIFLLALAWALTLTTSTLLTTIGPLSALELGASNAVAAFAIGVFLVGAAISSVPSAQLFAKYGRFYGFSVGCLCQFIGSLVGAAAMGLRCLPLVYIGCLFVGLGQGLGQFYRFSAVEVSPSNYKSRAITYVLSGGVIAAFLGPVCATNTASLDNDHKYLGSYLVIALIGIFNQITIFFVDFPKPVSYEEKTVLNIIHDDINKSSFEEQRASELIRPSIKHRTIKEIISQPLFILSCFVATVAHTIMVMLMSDVTLAMKDDGYSLASTSLVMELHFFSMFGPGFITGRLILIYGSFYVSLMGGFIFGGSAAIFLIGTDLWNFYVGMILLGIGWNFSFSAGTVMLTESYRPHEATRVQAINDFILFTIAGIGSLVAGFVYASFGWTITVYVTLVMAVGNIMVFGLASSLRMQKQLENESEDAFSSPRLSKPSMASYPADDIDRVHRLSEDDTSRKNSFDIRNTFVFNDMDEISQMDTVRSFSVA